MPGSPAIRRNLPDGVCCRTSMHPNPGICRSGLASWPNFHFKTHAMKRTPAESSCARFWIVSSSTGKWYSILYWNVRCMVPERGTAGTWSPLCSPLETPEVFAVTRVLRRNREHQCLSSRPTRSSSTLRGRRLGIKTGLRCEPRHGFRPGKQGARNHSEEPLRVGLASRPALRSLF